MAGEKILVMDDSPLVRKLAEVSLQEAGYEVYTASDGEEGLKIAEQIKPDLILVDFIMPKMTGSQVCKLIRENETLKDIPIILITGKGETVGQALIEKYGILDYFIKPFKSEELVEKINQVLSKAPEVKKIPEEIPVFTYESPETEIKEVEEIEPIVLPETEEEVFSVEEKGIELTKEIELKEKIFEEPEPMQKTQDLFETPEIELPEMELLGKEESFGTQEIESIQDILEEPPKTEIEEIKPAFDLTILEKLIDNKFNSFYEKIIPLLDSSVEGVLKKYGLIKDSSVILSGNLNFFKVQEIFTLINSNSLNGIFYAYSNAIAYEFLFISGKIIYGISNLQKQKIGAKLLNEMDQEEIKDITIEALNSLKNLQNGNFIFEKKDFSDSWLLNKTGYNPLELVKET
ncbi:response regulator [Thermodesulfovibrio sp. 3462-1]|uniref:Response regulator n=1 Tax=Thermodesulfovibrio obliviosus TaxID=3118332 RepID=A0AAU8GZP9_9BACT